MKFATERERNGDARQRANGSKVQRRREASEQRRIGESRVSEGEWTKGFHTQREARAERERVSREAPKGKGKGSGGHISQISLSKSSSFFLIEKID